MKKIKLNEKQKEQLKSCFENLNKADCIKQDADSHYYRACTRFWAKLNEIVPEYHAMKGATFNADDWSISPPC